MKKNIFYYKKDFFLKGDDVVKRKVITNKFKLNII